MWGGSAVSANDGPIDRDQLARAEPAAEDLADGVEPDLLLAHAVSHTVTSAGAWL